MPSTTPHHPFVADDAPPTTPWARAQAYARLLTTILLQPRRIYLKGRAPKDPRVHQLRRDTQREHAKPAEMILRLQLADLDDGAPLEAVLRFHEAAIVLLREYHDGRCTPACAQSLGTVIRVETRHEYRLNDAELRALEHQDDCAALEAVELEWAAYQEHGARMIAAVRERRLSLAARRALAGAVA